MRRVGDQSTLPVNRKAARKQARQEKSQRKANNYRQRKIEEKQAKRREWISKHSTVLSLSPKLPGKTVGSTKCKRPRPVLSSNTTNIHDDPLLAFAEEAIEAGILASDGDFDQDQMNDLFLYQAKSTVTKDKSEETNIYNNDRKYLGSRATTSDSEVPAEESSLYALKVSKGKTSEETTLEETNNTRLQRFLQGQINRLTLSNFDNVTTSIVKEIPNYPRHDFINAFINLLIGFLTKQSTLLDNYIMNYTALASAIAHFVGIGLIAYILERCVEILDEQRLISTQIEGLVGSKVVLNCITFFAFLYDLQIISKSTISTIMFDSINRIENELEVEVLVKLIRLCGAQLRRDDPTFLKEIIIKILGRAMEIPDSVQSSRFKFMLEVVQDLKNNKQKLVAIQHGELESIKKILQSFSQARYLAKLEPLNITLDDIRNAKTLGRWWQVGAAWKGHNDSIIRKADTVTSDLINQGEIMEKARRQHMNTDLRKVIFATLMTSEDYQDAYQSLLTLKLSGRQEQEIVHVILHCVTHEKLYNPFYALVAAQFIASRHNCLISFKYALWDRLELLKNEELPLRPTIHIAKFYGNLILHRHLSLSILKRVSFADLSHSLILFFKVLFSSIFGDAKDDVNVVIIFAELSDIINKNKPKKTDDDILGSDHEDQGSETVMKLQEIANLRAGLKVFFRQFMDHLGDVITGADLSLVRKRMVLAIQNLG